MRKKIKGFKMTSLVLMTAMIALLAGCGGNNKEADKHIGRYVGIELEENGETSDLDGESAYIDLGEKGKATLVMDDESFDCKWTINDDAFLLKPEGESSKYEGVLDDGYLVLDLDGMIFTFQKSDEDSVLERLKRVNDGEEVYFDGYDDYDEYGDYDYDDYDDYDDYEDYDLGDLDPDDPGLGDIDLSDLDFDD
ncbi:MAG: hypothetical protein K6E16_10310 [Lachnospiraceae bacterium]|nr:hypothetical protein [Lachnospiraceae bacterium]